MGAEKSNTLVQSWANGPAREDLDLARFKIPELAEISQEQLKQLFWLAYFDDLTGLANRVLLRERMGQAVARAQRGCLAGSLLFIDLDDFKVVNDNFGHLIGDQLLRTVAERLVNCIRPQDTAARIGGDEFGVLVADVDPKVMGEMEVAELVAERILAEIVRPAGDEGIIVSASIGIATFDAETKGIDHIIHKADSAMYVAKKKGNKFAWG